MVTAEEVDTVTRYCVSLRSNWTHYKIFFEKGELRRKMLHRIAPIFFGDLNQMLVEHLILQICKLTDPAVTMGRKNLTIDYLVDNADFSTDLSEGNRARGLRDRIDQFRVLILPARNKLISHLDRDSVLAGVPLGAAPTAAWDQFWADLDELLEIFNRRFASPPSPFRLGDVGMISDADSAVKALRESTFFQKALGVNSLTRALADIADTSEFSEG